MIKTHTQIRAYCPHPYERLKFDPEGFVTMCCFQKRRCVGNILTTPFEQLWFGPLVQEVRHAVSQGKLHRVCQIKSCPFFLEHTRKNFQSYTAKTYPSQFEIDLPNQHCNIGGTNPSDQNPACIMCERNRAFQPQQDRLNEVCGKLKPFIRHIRAIHIQGVAEPFWKERIYELIDMLDVTKYQHRISISTTTNGTLMGETNRKRFLSYPHSTITWSLDAATAETHHKIRRVKSFDKIIENLRAYSQERKATQHLHIHNNINLLNIHEVEQMVALAAEAKVDCLDFNPTYDTPDICVNQYNAHLFKEAQDKIKIAARRLGVHTTFMRDLSLDY